MAQIAQMAANGAITRDGDRVIVTYADGSGREFENATQFMNWIHETLASVDISSALLLGHLLAKDPLLDSLNEWNNKKLTLDCEQALPANVFKIQ